MKSLIVTLFGSEGVAKHRRQNGEPSRPRFLGFQSWVLGLSEHLIPPAIQLRWWVKCARLRICGDF